MCSHSGHGYNASLYNFCIFRPKFGNLVELTSSDFVEAIDKERPIVTVIVHIYAEVSITTNHLIITPDFSSGGGGGGAMAFYFFTKLFTICMV